MKKSLIFSLVLICVGMMTGPVSAEWWTATGSDIYNNNSGNVGIGTNPVSEYRLNLSGNINSIANAPFTSIPSNLSQMIPYTFGAYLNDSHNYGYVQGQYFFTRLMSGRQVGDPSNIRYIQGLHAEQVVDGGNLYGNSYGIFGLSYVYNSGTINGNSISVYGQGAIGSNGHVTGDLIGVYGNVYETGGQVDGKRWAGYFNGNTYVNGNLGIGNITPNYKLDVRGDIFINRNDANPMLRFGYIDATTWASIYRENSTGKLFIKNDQGNAIILDNGNVGIGTSSPQTKLAVNGTITAKEVKVTQTGWADYVFKDDYKLRTLDTVESFIKEHKHLPDMPSAKEVEKNGIPVADMLARQMQKIEELTLYAIQQNKKIEDLEKQLVELKKMN